MTKYSNHQVLSYVHLQNSAKVTALRWGCSSIGKVLALLEAQARPPPIPE